MCFSNFRLSQGKATAQAAKQMRIEMKQQIHRSQTKKVALNAFPGYVRGQQHEMGRVRIPKIKLVPDVCEMKTNVHSSLPSSCAKFKSTLFVKTHLIKVPTWIQLKIYDLSRFLTCYTLISVVLMSVIYFWWNKGTNYFKKTPEIILSMKKEQPNGPILTFWC